MLGTKGPEENEGKANGKDGRQRNNLHPGTPVQIVKKPHQRTGALTEGKVREILTRSAFHPHGIKVRLEDGSVGRVQHIL
jgi:uncharacterized repeat protein (TIGR03833 family)